MISRRETIEFFIIAQLMSIWAEEGKSAYKQCKDFLLSDMFSNKQLRWVYKVICEMYDKGWNCTCASEMAEYIIDEGKVPAEKVGSICCFLIEVYLQFCEMTKPVTGVKFTIREAVDELIFLSDNDEQVI